MTDFLYRENSPTQGRWLSPDPYMGSIDLTNPQSLNRYGYVMNNPLKAIDPQGAAPCAFFLVDPDPQDGGPEPCPGDDGGSPGAPFEGIGAGFGAGLGSGIPGNGGVTLDGTPIDPSSGLLGSGESTLGCPNNYCGPIAIGGVLASPVPYQTGWAFLPNAGPGSIFDTSDQAMIAGALYAENQSLINDGNEQCGMTYSESGGFSYTTPKKESHAACQPLDATGSIPGTGSAFGGYHSHGIADPNYEDERFSGQPGDDGGDAVWSTFYRYRLSLATPGGRVMIYYPISRCQQFFLGTAFGTGTTIPICH